MQIYYEVYILNNFLLNFLLNNLTQKICNLSVSKKRVIIASIFASLHSVIFITFDCNSLVFKLIGFIAILSVLNKYNNVFDLIKSMCVFLLLSIFCSSVFNLYIYSQNIDIYDIDFSFRLLVVYILFILLNIMYKMVKKHFLKLKKDITYFEKIQIVVNSKKINLLAYYDSGNLIYDKGDFVCVINKNLVDKLPLKFKKINLSTIAGENNLNYIILDELILVEEKKKFKNIKCVVSSNLSLGDFLLHRDMR